MARLGTLALTLFLAVGCGDSHSRDGRADAGPGVDGGARDGGARDGGRPRDSGGVDAGTRRDAGPPGDWAACSASPECIVLSASCCGSCGAAVPTDMVGVNQARAMEQRAEACAAGTACPECFMQQDQHLVATCAMGTCQAIDLREHAVTACTRDEECFLASPNCCDCGELGVDQAIAISDSGGLAALRCDPSAPACPPCAPTFPDHLLPYCDPASGHCRITIVGP